METEYKIALPFKFNRLSNKFWIYIYFSVGKEQKQSTTPNSLLNSDKHKHRDSLQLLADSVRRKLLFPLELRLFWPNGFIGFRQFVAKIVSCISDAVPTAETRDVLRKPFDSKYQSLTDWLTTNESFFKYFLTVTVTSTQHFNNCSRISIACLNKEQKSTR